MQEEETYDVIVAFLELEPEFEDTNQKLATKRRFVSRVGLKIVQYFVVVFSTERGCMPSIQCFMLEPTGRVRVSLRRYTNNEKPCPLYPGKSSYHNDKQFFCEEPADKDEHGYGRNGLKPAPHHEDFHWPQKCACGYVFQEEDEWQRFTEDIYRKDTGEEMTLGDAPAGAMWYAWWHDYWCTPQLEHALVVKTPGGDWVVDSMASNCTMKDDVKQEKHHCWVLHGTPPLVTADKNGQTCGAGAGSIQCGSYHGFLRNGFLED